MRNLILKILLALIILFVGILPASAEKNSVVEMEKVTYNWTWLGKAPLTDAQTKRILKTPKGQRPDPKNLFVASIHLATFKTFSSRHVARDES